MDEAYQWIEFGYLISACSIHFWIKEIGASKDCTVR